VPLPPPPPPRESPATEPGKIKVSNGTETLFINPEDEAEAAKDGYWRIG
jgi:hypothetical protein